MIPCSGRRAMFRWAVAGLLLAGCSRPLSEEPRASEAFGEAAFLTLANAYAQAIVDNDRARLSQLVSWVPGDLTRFLASERQALLTNFPSLGAARQLPPFSLVKLTRQDKVASAWLAMDGAPRGRPLSFVFEDGRWAVDWRPGRQ